MSLSLVEALRETSVLSVELRPPRAELGPDAGRDAWIDTYHAVRGLVRANRYVFLTDSAVGTREEHNLRHLVINLGTDVPRDHVVPFLTTKHPLDYCLSYAEQAWHEGFRSLVVLGGDRTVGAPRCVNHAWELRQIIGKHVPGLSLGGWANPHQTASEQVNFLSDERFSAQYFLTQVVSHHDRHVVDTFLNEVDRRNVSLPGIFGVFYYRSANPKTLGVLQRFLPVPAEALTREFATGVSPETVCARTLRSLQEAGVRHVYVSNLPLGRARQTLESILSLARSQGAASS
jgi:5,10-methylenetetrahydrofolate reductase